MCAAQPQLLEVEEFLTGFRDALSVKNTDLSQALILAIESLSKFVCQIRCAVGAVNADDAGTKQISTAADELGAIVDSTAAATEEIMAAAETIEQVAETVGEAQRDELLNATTRIYEACSFQDITGQRVAKVVNAFQQIEARIDAILEAVGGDGIPADGGFPSPHAEAESDEQALLNGPALPNDAKTQAEIDALFEEAGSAEHPEPT